MDLYAAVDLLGGRSVRLVRGDFDQQSSYGDPVAAAVDLAARGAPWLHVVDLDAARTGEPANRAVISDVVAAVPIPVQVGGGVRNECRAESLLSLGVARIVLGTAVLTSPDLVGRLAASNPGRVAVGLDHRAGMIAVRGWRETSELSLLDALRGVEDSGAAAVVVTDIGRDGTLSGPDLEGLRSALGATRLPLLASGGVASARDLVNLASLREEGKALAGVIVGKAIHEGLLRVEEAVTACEASG